MWNYKTSVKQMMELSLSGLSCKNSKDAYRDDIVAWTIFLVKVKSQIQSHTHSMSTAYKTKP